MCTRRLIKHTSNLSSHQVNPPFMTLPYLPRANWRGNHYLALSESSYKTWSLFSPLCCSSPLSLSWNSSLTCPILRVFQHSMRVSTIRMGRTCPWEYPLTKPTISPTLSTLQAACAPLPSLQPAHPPSSPPMASCVLCSALLVFPQKSTLAVV